MHTCILCRILYNYVHVYFIKKTCVFQHKESTKTVANDQEKEIETLEIKLKETESNWQSKLEKVNKFYIYICYTSN